MYLDFIIVAALYFINILIFSAEYSVNMSSGILVMLLVLTSSHFHATLSSGFEINRFDINTEQQDKSFGEKERQIVSLKLHQSILEYFSRIFLQEFLTRYQYMGEHCPDEAMRELSRTDPEAAFELAVKNFQEFSELPTTGKP